MTRRLGETTPRGASIQLESETAARPRLTTAKKLLFSGTVTIAFLAVLELLLAAAGWQPLERKEDPYVGFLSTAPLFVDTRGAHGELEMVTADNRLRWFNPQRFAKHKSKQTYRIFCLGGSTTYGHPYDDTMSFAGWLRELLPEVDASRQWEVVNAGGTVTLVEERESRGDHRLTLLPCEMLVAWRTHVPNPTFPPFVLPIPPCG